MTKKGTMNSHNERDVPEKEAAEQRLDSLGPLRETGDDETGDRESVADEESECGKKWPSDREHEHEAYRKWMLSEGGHGRVHPLHFNGTG
jgi:hypothetical protein